jgi:PAS domain-containing protein
LANRAASDLFGVRADELIRHMLSELLIDPAAFKAQYQSALRDGSARLDIGVCRADGSVVARRWDLASLRRRSLHVRAGP